MKKTQQKPQNNPVGKDFKPALTICEIYWADLKTSIGFFFSFLFFFSLMEVKSLL